MNSAEIRKPPVAPKPKFVVGLKVVPPPVAPKPDVVLAEVLQSTKKTKPAIAPKPKILKCSSVPEVKTAPPCLNKIYKSLEESSRDSSEYLLHLNYKNGTPGDNTAYIISVCSCNFECIHKIGNGENICKNPTIFEQLENLENIDIGEQSSPPLKSKAILDGHNEKNITKNRVVLKANFLEEKLKDVLTQSVFPCSSCSKQKVEKGNIISDSDNSVKIECADIALSGAEEIMDNSNNQAETTDVEVDSSESSPLPPETINRCPCSLDSSALDNMNSRGTATKAENDSAFGTESLPPMKSLPVPRPRKLRVPLGLVRQDGIDIPGEGTKEINASEYRSAAFPEHLSVKQTKINVLVQSVSYNDQSLTCAIDKPEPIRKNHQATESKKLIPQDSLPEVLHENSHLLENVEQSLNLDAINFASSTKEDACILLANDNSGFVRCSNLSMSLPKQIKLSCNQQLPAIDSLNNFAPKKEDKGIHVKSENSPRIIPKKPQRHSIPAAGLLKKAASEELIDRSSYLTTEEKRSDIPMERPPIEHLLAQEQSEFCHTPKTHLEKPVWKLPHPILPFSGSPEALKNKNAKNSERLSAMTKPRAKSLSSVDMDRIHKPSKEPSKKNCLKKFLNMKLSVCLMKSDFQKYLTKGNQATDNTTVTASSGEAPCKTQNITSTSGKKHKPSKAHSAEIVGLFSQKGKQRSRDKDDIKNNQRSQSLDEPTSTSQQNLNSVTHHYIPEYENVTHYEEIPEYENLPFKMFPGKNSCVEWNSCNTTEGDDANIYEAEEPYEATGSCSQSGRSSAEVFDASDLVLEDVQSDDDMLLGDVNSSDDDDDTNSDSSKGEPDTQENKQIKAAGKKTKVYHIAKEIMSSEKVFVDVLKLLHIDFRDSVAHASRQLGKPVIEDRILNQILYYLPQLYELNRDLLRELEERLSHWTDHQRIADIFVKKGPYLKMYSTYIKEFDKNVALLDEQCKKNPAFAAAVRDFEMSSRCASLALKHYLLKPVQRIPQYRLLLTDYLKNLLEDSSDFRDTQDALAVVIEVANHANDIMKQGDNFQKLMQIQYSLNGHHEIVQPGRVFLKEGTLMKLSRKVMQPRMFFLFNDALLYTTPVQSGMYKLNNMLSLAGMKVRKPTHEAYQNELNIESVERSFILSASSAAERDEWLEAISKSIEEYTKKRFTFNPSKSLEEAVPEKEEEDSIIGAKAPIWIPDTRATMCMICTSEFTLTWRRHHCRACGKVICQACSSNKHRLDYMKNHPARVCDYCFKELQKQDKLGTPPKNVSPVAHKSPSSALSTVLHSIPSGRKQKKIPAALKEVSASTEDSSMSGYLYRSKGSKKPWKHLWFVIKNKVLYTYAASEDVAALESQPLLGFTVTEVKDDHLESKVFHLLHKNTLFYIFKADDPHTTQKWIEAFQEATIL